MSTKSHLFVYFFVRDEVSYVFSLPGQLKFRHVDKSAFCSGIITKVFEPVSVEFHPF
jgi:hypothetical protein